MQKKITGLLGAVAALGTLGIAQAAPAPAPDPNEVLKVNSFAELLEPIPNATALLKAVDEQPSTRSTGNIQLAQHHHHHHHHHHHARRHHHHHHHHHN
jgi:hypothetical protein